MADLTFPQRVRPLISNSAPITYSSLTGIIGITQSGVATDGYLSSTDWNIFNNKQNDYWTKTLTTLSPTNANDQVLISETYTTSIGNVTTKIFESVSKPIIDTIGSFTNDHNQFAVTPVITTGNSDGGIQSSCVLVALRNSQTAGSADNGTGSVIRGSAVIFGHNNVNAGAAPVTTTAYGIGIFPRYRTGSITTGYSLFIASADGANLPTNNYAIYQQSTTALNFFGGVSQTANIGINIAPAAAGSGSVPLIVKSFDSTSFPIAKLYRPAQTVNFGSGIAFDLNNNAAAQFTYADLRGGIDDNTAGAEYGHLKFRTVTNSAITEQFALNRYGALIATATPDPSFRLVINGASRGGGSAVNGGAKIFIDGLGGASVNGLVIANNTAATVGTQVQASPQSIFQGSAWDIDGAVAVSKYMRHVMLPVAGNDTGSTLLTSASNDGTTWTNLTRLEFVPTVSNIFKVMDQVSTNSIAFQHSGSEGLIFTNVGNFSFGPATGLVYVAKSAVNSEFRVYGSGLSTNYVSLKHNQTSVSNLVERISTAASNGASYTIQAGGGTVGGTNLNGGSVYIAPGISTSQGMSLVGIKRDARASASGTADNAQYDALLVMAEKNMVDNSAVGLFEVSLPAGAGCGGRVLYQLVVTDGTDIQSHSGNVSYAAVNKAGSYTTQISDDGGLGDAAVASAGTLADTWTIVTGTDKITITLNANTSLTPTSMKCYYTVHNGSNQTVTQL